MTALQDYLKTETSVTVVAGLLASHIKKSTSAGAKVDRLRKELEAAETEHKNSTECLQIIRDHADTMHARQMRPVDRALGKPIDVNLADTLATGDQ